MDFQLKQYKLSQKFSFILTIVYTFIGIIIAVLLGLIFSFISYHIQSRIIEFLLFIPVALLILVISKKLSRSAKVRNNLINFLICFIMCCFAYYTMICGIVYTLSIFLSDSFFEVFFSLFSVIDIIIHIILVYPAVMFDQLLIPSTVSIYIIFTLLTMELIIIFLPTLFALKIGDYYCENCQVWYKKYYFLSPSDNKLISYLSNNYTGSYASALANLPFYTPSLLFGLSERNVIINNPSILIYVYCQCLSCKRNSILSINNGVLKRKDKYFVTDKAPNPILIKNVYIDEQTDLLFTIRKQELY